MVETANLDSFLRSYIETALWSSTDENDEPMDSNYGPDDLAPETLAAMREECREFLEVNAELIGDEIGRAAHDFWLTRNGHGAGFWDGDWEEEIGRKLTDASHTCGERYLYVGNDGLIYIG